MSRAAAAAFLAILLAGCAAPPVSPTAHGSLIIATPSPAPTGRDPLLWSESPPPLPANAAFNDLARTRALLADVLARLAMPPLSTQGGLEVSEADTGDAAYLFTCRAEDKAYRLMVVDPGAVDEVARAGPHPWQVLPVSVFSGTGRTQAATFLAAQMRRAVASDSSVSQSTIVDGLLVVWTGNTEPGAREVEVDVGVPHGPGSTDPCS